MSTIPTLDEWVELAGFARLRDDILISCNQYLGKREAEGLARCCMIFIRQEIETAPTVYSDHGPTAPFWRSDLKPLVTTHTGHVVAVQKLERE